MDQKNSVMFPDHGELFPYLYGATSLYTDADNVRVPPTLESLPTEVQLQICREMLRSKKPIILSPCKPYVSRFRFGSLGILRVSKYFSTMALSVMYGENYFRLLSANWIIKDDDLENDDSEDDDLEDDDLKDDDLEIVHIKTLRHSPWENLRNMPLTHFGNLVSSVDCLDMISQTSSGQAFLKHLQIDLGCVAWVHVMDGVLLRILKRMRGLQSLDLNFVDGWVDLIRDQPLEDDEEKWEERNARDFLLLVKEELSHIKKITMESRTVSFFDDPGIFNWMAHELKKRNEAWAPPLPSYKKFRRTFSPMSIMDAEVAKTVVQFNDKFRSEAHEQSLAHLERAYGVF